MSAFFRYSPLAIEGYAATIGRTRVGPVSSAFLRDDPWAWNLAFLSHPFERLLERPLQLSAMPADPRFNVLVRRSLQMDVHTGVWAPHEDPARLVYRYLGLPAPQAVTRIMGLRHLRHLPLVQAYGFKWVDTIYERSWLAQAPVEVPDEDPGSLDEAATVLRGVMRG